MVTCPLWQGARSGSGGRAEAGRGMTAVPPPASGWAAGWVRAVPCGPADARPSEEYSCCGPPLSGGVSRMTPTALVPGLALGSCGRRLPFGQVSCASCLRAACAPSMVRVKAVWPQPPPASFLWVCGSSIAWPACGRFVAAPGESEIQVPRPHAEPRSVSEGCPGHWGGAGCGVLAFLPSSWQGGRLGSSWRFQSREVPA